MHLPKAMLSVSGIEIELIKKAIKNLHLAVYPPDGRVRVSAPKQMSDDNIRLAVISKLGWIKKQQQDFAAQSRQSERQYISGECHYFFGKRCRLMLIERDAKPEVRLLKSGRLQLFVRPGATLAKKEALINDWYRQALKQRIPELLTKWQAVVGKEAKCWGVKKMKTKWGSCNIGQRRIWLNLELAKKPPECLEYVLVHELVHLHERYHNQRFKQLMEQFYPAWQQAKKRLDSAPLAYEDWAF